MTDFNKNSVFQVENKRSNSKLLITVEHAGNLIPKKLNLGLNKQDLSRHISYDIGIKGVALEICKKTNFKCILSRYSRLVVDLNRPHNSKECIREKSDGSIIMGNKNLSTNEKKERLLNYHIPFHNFVAQTINKFEPKVLLSLHSFTPKLNEEKLNRPWQCGVLYGESLELGKKCIEFLRDKNSLCVGDNQPYKIEKGGDYTIPIHGDERNIPAILIEIRQDLITTVKGQKEWAELMVSMINSCFQNLLID